MKNKLILALGFAGIAGSMNGVDLDKLLFIEAEKSSLKEFANKVAKGTVFFTWEEGANRAILPSISEKSILNKNIPLLGRQFTTHDVASILIKSLIMVAVRDRAKPISTILKEVGIESAKELGSSVIKERLIDPLSALVVEKIPGINTLRKQPGFKVVAFLVDRTFGSASYHLVDGACEKGRGMWHNTFRKD